MPEATSPLWPGVVIAQTYEIERQLGRGGMGEVWLARHLRLAGKHVAVKVLHVDPALPTEALARFKREAEIAARLEHPNIVQVADFNTLPSGQPYLVMEFLKGQSLAARAQGRALGFEQVAGIMRQVGAALQAAHRAGVVHRDLKPENIFLVPTAVGDQVKVLDFGISKLSGSNTVQTTDSALLGTPLYMSPEQALGNNRDVGPQSDLFSLGSICYELFTGQAPFLADNIAKVIFRIAYEKHQSLASLKPELAPSVIAAVEHLLEKQAQHRTTTIEAFVFELTGQPLAEVAQSEIAGVYTPGMLETPSMSSGKTRAPSGAALPHATAPASAAPAQVDSSGAPLEVSEAGAGGRPAGAPPGESVAAQRQAAPTVSGRKLMLALVGGAVIVAAVVAKVRTDNWAERAIYQAGMIDAGYLMLADGTFITDAGRSAAVIPVNAAAAIDAGPSNAAALAVAGGSGGGSPPAIDSLPRPRNPQARLSATEEGLLASLEALEKKERWDDIWDARSSIRAQLQTPAARTQGLSLLVESVCARSDNAQLSAVVAEFKAVASTAQLRAARQRCIKRYPSAEYLSW